ncbi:GTPase IMAP family member 4-like isoform X2 [Arapaima gigas]
MMDEVRLVLLGRRGSGKSSCGNTILGSMVFRTILSTTPVTTECEEHTATIHGRRVTVIDTPDFFGDSLPDPKSHIQKCISMVRQKPSVFLLVLQLGCFTEGEKKIVTQVQQAFRSKVKKNMIVVFSHGDDLEEVTIEEFMKNAHRDVKDLVKKCGNRYHVLNNRDTSSDRQVTELLTKVNHMLNLETCPEIKYVEIPTGPRLWTLAAFNSPDRPENIQLVLLGRRRSGKSSCGNTILGSKVFRSFLSTTPVTIECEEHTATIHRRRVIVIDTPDFTPDFSQLEGGGRGLPAAGTSGIRVPRRKERSGRGSRRRGNERRKDGRAGQEEEEEEEGRKRGVIKWEKREEEQKRGETADGRKRELN